MFILKPRYFWMVPSFNYRFLKSHRGIAMPSSSKKHNRKQSQTPKLSNFAPPLIHLAIEWLYGYLKDYCMPGIIIILILAIVLGKPVEIELSLIILIVISLFLLLHYLIKKLDPEGTEDNDR
jgi:hypothetical protein